MLSSFTRYGALAGIMALLGCGAAPQSYDLVTYMGQTGADEIAVHQVESRLKPLQVSRRAGSTLAPMPAERYRTVRTTAALSEDPEPAAVITATRIADAIQMATGRIVTRVVFVPADAANDRGGHDDGSLHVGCMRCRIGTTLSAYLERIYGSAVSNGLEVAGASKLRARVRATFGDGYEPGVLDAVYYTAGLAMLGDDRSHDLDALIRLFPHYVPLGEKIDEPGTWYVKTGS